ncbi:MAG: hypothetical protein HY828_16385 [Actinobacteria bacterium]|nr:hypothetical protein [Actinomycetota bacterium]
MPSRRHTKSAPTPKPAGAPAPTAGRDPAEMFAAALRESEARDAATRERDRQQKEAAAAKAEAAAAAANALKNAQRDLDRAIRAVRDAKAAGRSTVEADAAWKAAKARVIELETGERPTWAPTPAPDDSSSDDSGSDDSGSDEEPVDSPVDDAPVAEE